MPKHRQTDLPVLQFTIRFTVFLDTVYDVVYDIGTER